MSRARLAGFTLVALGLARVAFGQQPPPLKPFTPDDGKPVLRALPVATPIPIPRATPAPEKPPATPKPVAKPPKPNAVPQPDIPDPTGEIRLTPSGTSMSADQLLLSVADGYYLKQMFDMAAPEYEKYLGMYPTAPERATALFRLAESYRRNGTVNAAKNTYETLLNQFGTGEFIGPAAYRLADLYYQERNYRLALPMFRKASVRLKEPKLVNMAKFYTGRTLEGQGNKTEARFIYEELVGIVNDNPFMDASRLSLGVLLKEAGKTDLALKQIQALQKTTENADLKAEATVRAGLWQLELNQPKKAAEDLEEALKMPGIGKWKDVAQIGLLQMKFNDGKYQEILDQFGAGAAEVSADSRPQFLVIVGNSYRQLGKHKEALALYDQLIKDAPNTLYARDAAYERIKCLFQIESPDLSAEIDQFLTSNPDNSNRDQVILMKAELLFKAQDYPAAAPLYELVSRSRQLIGNYKAKALYKFGWCSLQTKENDKAIRGFTELIDGYPTSDSLSSAYFQRGIARLRSKDLAGALKDLNDLTAKYPKAKEREPALEQKAIIQGLQNDTNGMVETYKLLLGEFPKTAVAADANYWIGSVAFENKSYKDVAGPLGVARKLDKEKFFERASLRILLAHYYLEDWDSVGREIDLYGKEGGKGEVPEQVLRGVGMHFFELGERAEKPDVAVENFTSAAKYLALMVKREDAKADDFLKLGRSQLQLGKFKESADALGTYLKSVKDPAPRCLGLLALTDAAVGMRDFDAAQKAVDEALRLQSEGRLNARARIANGDIQFAQGNFESAAKIYESVSVIIDDEEITPRAMDKSVEAYKRGGKDAEAKRLLNTLESRYPEYGQKKKRQ